MKISSHTLIPKKLFSEILNAVPIITIDVLFLNKKKTKTLLFKRTNAPLKGIYFSVGGRLLKNEMLLDGATRQALREAGISVDKRKLIFGGIEENIHRTSAFKGISYHAIVVYYGYIIDEKVRITLDDQHSGYVWLPVSSKKIHPFIRKRLRGVLKNI